VRLVEHERARRELDQAIEVRLEDVVVQDDDVGALRLVGPRFMGAPAQHGHLTRRQPAPALALPHQLHRRRAEDDRGERLVGLERRQRLHRLAEALLVGDECLSALECVAHAGALERVELAAELEAFGQGSRVGVGERDDLLRAVVLGHQLVDQLARRLLHIDARMRHHEVRQVPAKRRVARHRHAGDGGTVEDATLAIEEVRLRQLPEVVRGARVPAGHQRQLRLSILANLDRHLGWSGLAAGEDVVHAPAREVVELQALEPQQQLRALPRERQLDVVVPDRSSGGDLRGRIAPKRAQQERARPVPALMGGDDAPPAGGVAQPAEHLAARRELWKARKHRLDRLGEPRIGRNPPVLAPPVEPPSRQLPDRVVQLVMDRKAEDELALAPVVLEQEDPPRDRGRRAAVRIGHQPNEASRSGRRRRLQSARAEVRRLPAWSQAGAESTRHRRSAEVGVRAAGFERWRRSGPAATSSSPDGAVTDHTCFRYARDGSVSADVQRALATDGATRGRTKRVSYRLEDQRM
jgi:hypothetical protein